MSEKRREERGCLPAFWVTPPERLSLQALGAPRGLPHAGSVQKIMTLEIDLVVRGSTLGKVLAGTTCGHQRAVTFDP